MLLSKTNVDAEEEAIRARSMKLSDDDRKIWLTEVIKKTRDPDTYAVLNWSLFFGLHHFYLGRYFRAPLEWLAGIFAVASIYLGYTNHVLWTVVGFLGLFVVICLDFYELFRSQIIVQHYNNEKMDRALRKFE
jgi:hypothetical protein